MAIVMAVAHVLGALSSLNALMRTRTPQGTVAWIVSLNTLPIVAVPAYWVFGRDKFRGYATKRRAFARGDDEEIARFRAQVAPWHPPAEQPRVAERLAELPYLTGNAVELLIDGQATFDSILAGIDGAQDSVLVQFYIVRDDELGRTLKDKLIAKAQQGVRVHFLFDEVGSAGLPSRYVRDLTDAGVAVTPFHSSRGPGSRAQLNFRNHRKIVVADSRQGWVGGHNVGDEYLGRNPEVGPWRDTHLRIEGPAVLGLMISFAEDWRWATGERILSDLWHVPSRASGDAGVLILPTGPADRLETASLMFQLAIQSAEKRLWIASPYFVPDQAVMHALHLAAMQGVDVRILIPERPDNVLVYYSAYAFLGELLTSGVRVYRYQPGFLHEKVVLVDDLGAAIGTANFDNRSFRLNFEVTAFVVDEPLVDQVEAMFERDFGESREMTVEDVEGKGFWFRLASRASYLTAPVQ